MVAEAVTKQLYDAITMGDVPTFQTYDSSKSNASNQLNFNV